MAVTRNLHPAEQALARLVTEVQRTDPDKGRRLAVQAAGLLASARETEVSGTRAQTQTR